METVSGHFLHGRPDARFVNLSGHEAIAHFGAPAVEYDAARERVALHDASYRPWLRITGEDRLTFLHGMVTQDINGLAAGHATYAAMLTVKGAMVADARVLRREEDLILDLEPGTAARVLEFLGKYLISEEAELHDATDALALLRLIGPRTEDTLAALLGEAWAPLAHLALREVKLAGVPVLLAGNTALGLPGVDLVVPRASLGAVWDVLERAGAPLGLRPLGIDALEILRVEAGVPRFGQDMGETTIPLEANLAHAISYNKGCYIGQEVIARATFRGHMNRKLTGLLLSADVAPGDFLMRADKKVGWITSVVQSPQLSQRIGLGYVHRDSLDAGTLLVVGEGVAHATVQPLPFPLARTSSG